MSKSVLIVEDDKDISLLYRRWLLLDGNYSVASLQTSEEKSNYQTIAWDAVDTLVLDVLLHQPDLTGFDIALWVRANHPGVRIILITILRLSLIPNNVQEAVDVILAKPFSPQELMDAL